MILLVVLLGSVSMVAAVVNGSDDPGVVMDANKKLVSITAPSIDLDLSSLGLLSLDSDAFANCASARTLDLSNNSIKNVPKGVFSPLTNLEHLSLAKNNLGGKTMKKAFLGLVNLKSLNITYNPLSRILKNENFVGLTNSCEIYVGRSNNFRTLTPLAFGKIKKPEPKSRTIAAEGKNCPDRLDDRIEMFEVERSWILHTYNSQKRRKLMQEPFSDVGVKMCKDSTTVRLVDFSNVTDTLSPNCRSILINLNRTKLRIYDETITSFESGWLKIRNTSVNAIYLYPRTFVNLTSDLLNDLPENIRFFSLQMSELERLHRGVMVNEHLRGLDLSGNFIRFIEENAFAGMKLTRLNLGFNPIVTLDYVPTLPETLLWLNLEFNYILEIPVGRFSHLKSLLALNLVGNHIAELVPGCFRGLSSLQWLDMSAAHVTNLRPNGFQYLSRLHSLGLHRNKISRLEKGAFNDLGCLAELVLSRNNVTIIDRGAFDGLTDSLSMMDLHLNNIETLQAGTFVGAPKFNLSLQENYIRKIEKDAFDLPYLKYLDLRSNGLSTIERGAAKNLGSLADGIKIRLGYNNIRRLDNGALGGLPSNAYVYLVQNPVRVIQAGVFDDS